MSITITSSPKLKIHCSSLIVKYQSVATNFDELKQFQSKLKCNIISNGELIMTHDMMSPSENFHSIIEEILIPSNLIEEKDFVLAEEQLIYGVRDRITTLINQEHPDLKGISWIDSEITLDGNLLWLHESKIIKSELDDSYWINLIHRIQKVHGDYLAGKPIIMVKDLGEKLQIHQQGVKNGCLYVSKDFLRHFFDVEI